MSIPKGKRVRINSPDEGVLYGIVTSGNNTMGYSVKLDDGDSMIVSHQYLTCLEGIDKPRIKKSPFHTWQCKGARAVGFGVTPQEAYNWWRLLEKAKLFSTSY